MKTALITGVNGFVGQYLANHLLAEGFEVIGLDVANAPACADLNGRSIKYLQCNVLDKYCINELLMNEKPDEIYHLAALANITDSLLDPELTLKTNILGTLNILEAVRQHVGDSIFLYVGTASVYGIVDDNDIPIDEFVSLNPINPYSVSKASADLLCYQYWVQHSLRIIRVRPFAHIGPRQPLGYVASDFAFQIAKIEAREQKPTIHVGNLETRRDFTDVRDIVKAYRLAVRYCRPGAVYNVGSGIATSMADLLNQLISLTSVKVEVIPDPARMRTSDNPVLQGDCRLFRRATGWRPTIPFKQTLTDILDFWRQQVSSGISSSAQI